MPLPDVSGLNDEPLSPELALVDPVAAEHARRVLSQPALFEDLLRERIAATRAQAAAAARVERVRRSDGIQAQHLQLVVPTEYEEPAKASRRVLPILGALAAGVVVGVGVAVGVLVVSHVGGSSPSASLAATAVAASEGAHPPPRPPKRSLPDFVWVTAAGAYGYSAEFSRGRRVAHAAKTDLPRLRVPAGSLPAGRYRWRVWPLGANHARLGAPIVDSSLTVR